MQHFVNRLVVGSVIFVLAANPALAALQDQSHLAAGVAQRSKVQQTKTPAVSVEQNQIAAGVVLDPNNHQTDLKQAANGTTVVDIAAPTAKGVSQNNFSEFNVDQNGIIFNNSQGPVLTQLGGWSDGNRRLAGGTAKIILTQVTGNNRSQLQGQVEIAGQAADFILANANGITCNGCGFINTPRVSLVTGNAQYGADGSLGFNVLGGDVAIEGEGLNASNISRFDIITRAAKINSAIYANQLNIITGKNSVNYSSGDLKTLTDSSDSTPVLFAIDSSLLGGMYGNNIRLIGTEKGLGVNTQGLVQSVSDLEITADGDIQLKKAQANNQVKIESVAGALLNQGTVYGKNVSLSAQKDISNQGLLAAEEALKLAGNHFNQTGNVYSGLKADNTLTGTGNLTALFNGKINNSGDFFAAGSVNLQSDQLNNSGAFVLQSEKNITGINKIQNNGTLQFNAQDSVNFNAQSLDNQNGILSYSGNGTFNLKLLQDINNTKGALSSHGNLNLQSSLLNNKNGVISAQVTLLNTQEFDNTSGTLETAQLNLTANHLNNQQGVVTAISKAPANLSSSIFLTGDLDNQQGVVYFNNANSNLSAQSIHNAEGLLIFANQSTTKINMLADIDNQLGLIQSGDLNLAAKNLQNTSGQIIAANGTLNTQNILNSAGQLQADRWTIESDSYTSVGGVLLSTNKTSGGISLLNSQEFNQSLGAVTQTLSGDLQVAARNISNLDSALYNLGTGQLTISSEKFNNKNSTLVSDGITRVTTTEMDNALGFIAGKGLTITSTDISNQSGEIRNNGALLTVIADAFDNTKGLLASEDTSTVVIKNNFNNTQGVINNSSLFKMTANDFNNQEGLLQAGVFDLTTQDFNNSNGGSVFSGGSAQSTLNTNQWNNNSGSLAIDQLKWIAVSLSNQQGDIAGKAIDLQATDIDNTAFGKIATIDSLSINAANKLDNQNGIIQSNGIGLTNVNAKTINNIDGNIALLGAGVLTLTADQFSQSNLSELYAQNDLQLKIKNDFNNAGSIQAVNNLTVTAANINNSQATSSLLAGQVTLNGTNFSNAGHVEANQIQITGTSATNTGVMIASATTGQAMQFTLVGNLLNQGTLENNGTNWSLSRVDNQGTIQLIGAGLLDLSNLDNKTNGKIYSNGDIKISGDMTAGTFSNAGVVSAVNNLNINIANTNNQNGKLIAGKEFAITGATLDNRAGVIASQSASDNALAFNLNGLLNNTNNGQIESASKNWMLQNIALDNTGGIINHLGSGSFTLNAQGDLKNTTGKIQSNGNIFVNALDSGANVNNAQGLIHGNVVQVSANNSILNTGVDALNAGEISGANLRLSATTIDNTLGHLIANDPIAGSITFNTPNIIKNISGEISSSAQNWQLNFDQFDNAGGSILHTGAGALTLTSAAQLKNAGTISSVADVILNSAGLDNSGKIVADKNLTINSSGNITNQLTGVISVNGDLAIQKNGVAKIDFINLNEISSGGKFDLAIGLGDVTNSGSLAINATDKAWNVNSFTNGGTLSHNGVGNFDLTANNITNNGNIWSENGTLNFTASSITNNKVILANQFNALDVSSFKNTSGATLSSRQIQINNDQAIKGLFENDGAIEAAGSTDSLSIYTAQFNNLAKGTITTNSDKQEIYGDFTNAGIFTHAGTVSLELGRNGSVTVSGSGEINSAATINVLNSISGVGKVFSKVGIDIKTGATFTNAGLTYYTLGDINVHSSIANNLGGVLQSEGSMIFDAGLDLNNDGGTIQSNTISFDLKTLSNQLNGKIISLGVDADGHIYAQSINNNGGSIKSENNNFTLTATSGDINNSNAGLILHSGKGQLTLSADGHSINNDAGSILTAGSLAVTSAQTVINSGTHAGDSNTPTTGIVAGSFDIKANQFDNSNGYLNGTGIANLNNISVTDLINSNGSIYANAKDFTINATTSINNANGLISHSGNGTLDILKTTLDLSGTSKILSAGKINLISALSLTNNGSILGDLGVVIDAQGLNNTGVIGSAKGDVDLRLANFNLANSGNGSSSGIINGNNSLIIHAKSISNAAALESNNNIDITANGFSQIGNILSNNALSIHLSNSDLVLGPTDKIQAPGSLNIYLDSEKGFDNAGLISSVNGMVLDGKYLTNRATGKILVGDGPGVFNFTSDVTNSGMISAKNTLSINAYNFTNDVGAEVITGNDLSFALSNNFTNYGTIFSAENITISKSKNILNAMLSTTSAEIYAGGSVDFFAENSFQNISSRIEAVHDLKVSAAQTILNQSTTPNVQYDGGCGTDHVYEYSPYCYSGVFFSPDIGYYAEIVGGNKLINVLAPAKLYAGENLILDGGTTASITNSYGDMDAGKDISVFGGSFTHKSVTLGTERVKIYLSDYVVCDSFGYTDCYVIYDLSSGGVFGYRPGSVSISPIDSHLIGHIHAGGNITKTLAQDIFIANDPQDKDPASKKDPSLVGGTPAADVSGSGANNKLENAVDVNGNPITGGATSSGNYFGAKVTLADLQAGSGSNGKTNASATGADANQQNGKTTQPINYLNAVDANQLKALAQSGALGQLLAQLNDGNLTPQQVLDLINQLRSGKNPFSTDKAMQDFLNSVNLWFAENLTDAEKESLVAQTDLTSIAANTKINSGNTQAPTLIQIDILPYGFNLNNLSGLYVINNAPNSRYLIETRPEFTQYGKFLGSDYLLGLLGLDPDKTQKRLGDAFFENQLIKDSLMRDLSLRYLDGALDDYAMMQMLMDNAVNENKSLHLTVGVELTPEQCAHLTEDMLWLVEKTVKGQKVLVPHLYLTSVSKDKLEASSSALAAGGSIEMTAKNGITNNSKIVANNLLMSTQGSLDQNGTLIAHGDIRLLADQNIRNIGKISGGNVNLLAKADVTNSNSIIAANNLQIASTQGSILNTKDVQLKAGGALNLAANNDIKNQNLSIEGNNVSLFTKNGDIIFEAPASGIHKSGGAELIAHTDFKMDSGHNIDLQGTQIKALGDISIAAANDLNFIAEENKQHSESISKNKKVIDDKITHRLVNIESTSGNIQLNAGNDANLIGTNVTADKNIIIHAERDTNISAVVDSEYHYDKTKKKSGGVLTSKSKTTTNETLKETAVGGNISGDNVLINAHVNDEGNVIGDKSGNVNLLGANITAKSNVIISADEDVNASGIQTQETEFHRVQKSGSFGLSKRDSGSVVKNTHLTNANIGANENVIVLADNIKLVGANVTATNGNINMEAVDQLLLSAGEISQTAQNWNNKSGVFTGGQIYSKHEHKDGITETSTQASNIRAGGTVTAKAGAIKIEGSNISGDKGVGLSADAGDIEITAAETRSEAYTHDKDLTVGLGDVGKNLSRPDKWVKNKSGRATLKFADAQYSDVDEKTTFTGSQASTIESADGNIIANASEGKITLAGSNVTAEKGTVGLIGANGVDVTTVSEAMDKEKKSTIGSAEMSVVVQHQAAEVVVAALAVETARKKLEQAKKDYKSYERNLDGLQTQLKEMEGDYAAKKPGVNYDDIVELRQLISDTKGDASFYKAGIALAALNVTTSSITLAQQIATAAASSGTYGFNAGMQLDLDATKSKTETHDTFETGSKISANNVVIQTGKKGEDGKFDAKNTTTNIHGSSIKASDSVAIHTGDLNVTAGEATHESSTETQHGHITAQVTVYGAAGGASVSGSFDRNKNSERSNTYTNSEITGDKIDITTTDDANFRGATVRAESELNMDVGGNLNVESVQNRSSTRSTGFGVSGGISFGGTSSKDKNDAAAAAHNADSNNPAPASNAFTKNLHGAGDVNGASGVNGGINVSNGRSSTKETVLTSLTSGGTANINVKGHTQLTGAEIATTDKDGNDLGNLNFSTGSFNFTDLKNTNYSSNASVGVSSNLSISGGNKNSLTDKSTTPTGKTLNASSSNLTFSSSQTNDASKTLATLGHGNITVGGVDIEKNGELTDAGKADSLLTGLNRDVTKIDKSLWSSSTSQSVDVTLDHRLLSEGGRQSIKNDFVDSAEFGQDIGRAAKTVYTKEDVGVTQYFDVLGVDTRYTQLKNDLTRNGDNQWIIDGLKDKNGDEYAAAYKELGRLAQEKFGISEADLAKVYLYDGSKTTSDSLANKIAGTVNDSKNSENANIFINAKNGGDKYDQANSLGHEVYEKFTLVTGGKNDAAQEGISKAAGDQFADRMNQATGGGLTSTGGYNFNRSLLNSMNVFQGTMHANDVGGANVEYRAAKYPEADSLAKAYKNIDARSNLTPEQKEQEKQNYKAAACAEIRCADHVPLSDKNYGDVKKLQDQGDVLAKNGFDLNKNLIDMNIPTVFYTPYKSQSGQPVELQYPMFEAGSKLIDFYSQSNDYMGSGAIKHLGEKSLQSLDANSWNANDIPGVSYHGLEPLKDNPYDPRTWPTKVGDALHTDGSTFFNNSLSTTVKAISPQNSVPENIAYATGAPFIGLWAGVEDVTNYLLNTPANFFLGGDHVGEDVGLLADKNYKGDKVAVALHLTAVSSGEFNTALSPFLPLAGAEINLERQINNSLGKDATKVLRIKNAGIPDAEMGWSVTDLTKSNQLNKDIDTYLLSDGSTIPATGYRYMRLYNDDGTINNNAIKTMESGRDKVTFFGFDKFNSAAEARDAFQVKGPNLDVTGNGSWSDSRLLGVFDTKQLIDEAGNFTARVPFARGDNAQTGLLEPITYSYPNYGSGGVVQLHADRKLINFDSIIVLPEGAVNNATNNIKIVNPIIKINYENLPLILAPKNIENESLDESDNLREK